MNINNKLCKFILNNIPIKIYTTQLLKETIIPNVRVIHWLTKRKIIYMCNN